MPVDLSGRRLCLRQLFGLSSCACDLPVRQSLVHTSSCRTNAADRRSLVPHDCSKANQSQPAASLWLCCALCLCHLLPSHYPVQLLSRCCVWQETFGTLKDWVRELKMQGPSNILIAVVGQSVTLVMLLPCHSTGFCMIFFAHCRLSKPILTPPTFINSILIRSLSICPPESIRSDHTNMLHPYLI